MANNRLQEDYITWVLDLNATKAEQEYHKLDKESQTLKNRQKEINRELKDLRQHPRKNAAEIKKLTGEYKSYSATIQDNTNKMKALSRQMGTSNLSMSQLRRHASDLQRQLDKTSKSLHPREWESLNKQLLETKNRMSQLKMESAGFSNRDIKNGALYANIVSGLLTSLINKAKEFTREGIRMAESADGVQRAFDKLNRPDLLDNLRKATKGTVSDLQLMQAAVKARDFRIPLDDLGKYLAYAQMKAQETGQSVEYMTDSIIMGLGRKSKPILDNLGLSAAEINEEIAKTGDFVTGVTAIVDRQLAAAGDAYVSAADRATKASVELENAQLKLGQALLPLQKRWTEAASKGANLLALLIEHRRISGPLAKAILVLALAKLKFNAATTAGNIALKAQNALLVTAKAVALAASAAYNAIRGNAVRAAAAQRALNAAVASNPFGLLLTVLATVVSAIMSFTRSAEDAAEVMGEFQETTKEEIENLDTLFTILEKSEKGTRTYKKALEKINSVCEDYNVTLLKENTTLAEQKTKYEELRKAIQDTTAEKIRAKYIEQAEKEESESQDKALKELQKRASKAWYRGVTGYQQTYGARGATGITEKYGSIASKGIREASGALWETVMQMARDAAHKLEGITGDAYKEMYNDLFDNIKEAVKDATNSNADAIDSFAPDLQKAFDAVIQSSGKAKESVARVDKEIKSLLTIPAPNPEPDNSQAKSLIKELEEQRKQLVEERDSATTEADIKAKNREIEVIDAKIKRLQDLGKIVKETAADEQSATQLLSQQRSRLQEQEKQATDNRTALLKKQLDDGLISQGEYDVQMAASAVTSAQQRLKIEQDLQAALKTMSFKTAAEREKADADAAQRILEAETVVNKARVDEEQVFRDNLKAIRESGVLEQEKTLAQQRAQELAALDIYYQAALKQAADDAEKQKSIKEAYLEAAWRITRKYAEKEQALEEANIKEREQLREQLGLVSWKAALDARQQLLEEALRKRALTEDEYARKSTQIWMEAWHEQAAYYQNMAASAFESLMQSEMDLSAARYDVLISQAQKAGQDTAALEEEKEAKQLEIQKKYADVNFAVKASQIIADTAVSIMQAYAQLGPVAGTVAAVLMGVVGAAQLASANAERERVKQLQPGSAASSSSGANTRVLTGREKGGYISVRRRQDGKLFRNVAVEADKRGYIDRPTVIVGEGPQSKEFVASNAAVENPTVAPLLDIIDKAQMAGNIRSLDMNREIQARMIGRVSGGGMDDTGHGPQRRGDSRSPVLGVPGMDTLERLDDTLRSLQRDGIPASVALTEIDRKRELRDRARKIGSKR